jgi:hypothetical protein
MDKLAKLKMHIIIDHILQRMETKGIRKMKLTLSVLAGTNKMFTAASVERKYRVCTTPP